MDRRDFIKITGLGLGSLMLPINGRVIAAEALNTRLDVAFKKRMADTALTAAQRERRQLLRRAHRPLPAASS